MSFTQIAASKHLRQLKTNPKNILLKYVIIIH